MKIKVILIALFLLTGGSYAVADTNYVTLLNKCQGNDNPGCCISSVRAMRDGKFQQATDGQCPEGYEVRMNKCKGSLSWCEPKDNQDIAVNGGGIGNYRKEAEKGKNRRKAVSGVESLTEEASPSKER